MAGLLDLLMPQRATQRAAQEKQQGISSALDTIANLRFRQEEFERKKAQQAFQAEQELNRPLDIPEFSLGTVASMGQEQRPELQPPPQPVPPTLEEIRAGVLLDPKAARKEIFGTKEPEKKTAPKTIKKQRPNGTIGIFAFGASTGEFDRDIGDAPGRSPLVTLSPGETELEKQLARITANRFEEFQKVANTKTERIGNLKIAQNLLEGVKGEKQLDTGTFSKLRAGVKKVVLGLGFGEDFINTEALARQEAFLSRASLEALFLRNPKSGLGLTGNTSEKDLAFLQEAVFGLGRTFRGNQLIIEALMSRDRHERDKSELAVKFFNEHKSFKGWEKIRDEFEAQNPIVSADFKKRVEKEDNSNLNAQQLFDKLKKQGKTREEIADALEAQGLL